METTTNLNPETIAGLQELIEINIDSGRGFRAAADRIEDARIASFFRDCAVERDGFARDLARYVELNAVEPKDGGSAQGTAHRWWLELRGAVQRGDEHAVLSEAERGEDAIKARYEKVLKDTAGSPLNSVLQHQYASVKARHDQVRAMRDANVS